MYSEYPLKWLLYEYWYNHTGELGVKHQVTYLLSET